MMMLPDLARSRRIAASDAATHSFFPATRAHDAFFFVPESHNDTLDLSMEPASLAAVAANEHSALNFRTLSRFYTAIGGSDAAARESSPAPRPQDGTQDFSIESTSLAAVAANRDPGNCSTASSFPTTVRRSKATAREDFPTPCPQDGTLDFGIAPALPGDVTTRASSAENYSTVASADAPVRGSNTAARDFFSHASPTTQHTAFQSCTCFSRCCRHPRQFCWNLQYCCKF